MTIILYVSSAYDDDDDDVNCERRYWKVEVVLAVNEQTKKVQMYLEIESRSLRWMGATLYPAELIEPTEKYKVVFWIKPLKETDLGVAQAFFDP